MKKMMISAVLLGLSTVLSACDGGGSTPVNPVTTKVTGTVTSGSGTGTIALAGLDGSSLTSAPVDAAGNFSLTLPGSSAMSGNLVAASSALSSLGCTGTLTSSAAAARAFGFASLNATRGSGATQAVVSATITPKLIALPPHGDMTLRMWVYTDQDTTLSGSVDCGKLVNVPAIKSVNVNINAALKAGWNALQFSGSSSSLLSQPISVSGNVVAINDSNSSWATFSDLTKSLGF